MTAAKVPATKVSRAPRKPTAAEAAEAKAAELEADAAAEAAQAAALAELELPFEFSLELEHGEDTLVNRDTKSGYEIHVKRLSLDDSDALTAIRSRMSRLQASVSEDMSEEAAEEVMVKLNGLTREMGSIVFSAEDDAQAQKFGPMYRKFVARGLKLALAGSENDLGK